MTRSKMRVALVGADTLLGHEIKEVLESEKTAAFIDSYAANGEANFGEEEGDAVYRKALEPDSAQDADALVLAGSAEGVRKSLEIARARSGKLKLIDGTGHLDQQPEARIYGPLENKPAPADWLLVVAHPAASAISILLAHLSRYQPVVRAVFEIFEPASERGRAGIAELQQQTTALLAFRPLEKKIFDAQLSFAMLPAYGENAASQLAAIEQRIETHLATLLARAAQQGLSIPMPSLRVVQAPVFHGYTLSAWIEFENHASVEDVRQALSSPSIDVRTAEHEMPTNVGIAGQDGLGVGDIRVDRNNSRAIWLWAVTDNLRLVAERASELLKGMERPS